MTLAEILVDCNHYSIDSTTVLAHVSARGKGKRLADHARLEVPRHQSVDILRGPSVGHAN